MVGLNHTFLTMITNNVLTNNAIAMYITIVLLSDINTFLHIGHDSQ